MSNANPSGFGQFVPGFEFLQNLSKSASSATPDMPSLGHWIAPTLDAEELEKRIGELKSVHFWLEQNARALAATIQALEVQKMTLATLKGMNFNVGDTPTSPPPKAASTSARTSKKKKSDTSTQQVDPLQLWMALTQQFQHIANSVLKETTANATATPAAQAQAKPSTPKKRSATAKKTAPRSI